MVEIGATFLQALNLFIWVERGVSVLGVFKLLLVSLFVKGKVMIASDDNFVFVGKFSKEVLEPF